MVFIIGLERRRQYGQKIISHFGIRVTIHNLNHKSHHRFSCSSCAYGCLGAKSVRTQPINPCVLFLVKCVWSFSSLCLDASCGCFSACWCFFLFIYFIFFHMTSHVNSDWFVSVWFSVAGWIQAMTTWYWLKKRVIPRNPQARMTKSVMSEFH